MTRRIATRISIVTLVTIFYFFVSSVSASPSQNAPNRLLLLDVARAGHRIVVVGERGRIFFSDDNASSWRNAPSPTSALLTAVFFVDSLHGWCVGHDAVILRTEDGGEHWQLVFSAPDKQEPLFDVWFRNSNDGFAVGAYGSFYESHDSGKTWQRKQIDSGDFHFNAITGTSEGKVFLAGEAGSLFRSNDAGRTWEKLASPYPGSYFGIIHLANNILVIFGLKGHVFRSLDWGSTWAQVGVTSDATLMGGSAIGKHSFAFVGQESLVVVGKEKAITVLSGDNTRRSTLSSVLGLENRELLLTGENGVVRLQLKP